MLTPESFIAYLQKQEFNFFSGVPCSFFKHIIRFLDANKDKFTYVMSANEGAALATASGAYLGGVLPVVMLQNSGLGNLINPLTSLNAIYHIPALIFVSGRAYGVEDEPQHLIMGRSMNKMLESLEVEFSDLPQDEESAFKAIDQAKKIIIQEKQPFVFFVKKGTFSEYPAKKRNLVYEMKRIDVISTIGKFVKENDLVFATTGKPSRELFTVCDRQENFYMQGSMGHIGAVALGTALTKPDCRVVVIDGDGAFLMHMGTASTVGYYKPKNFIHIVIDNESYETTGDQDTTASTTGFAKIAEACGYGVLSDVRTKAELNKSLEKIFTMKLEKPTFVRVKINREETKDIPRITTKYEAPQITKNFKNAVASNRS